MSTNLEELVSKLESCVTAGDIEGGKTVLNKAKVALLTSDNALLTAQALECGVLLSLAEGDLEAFSRHMSLLLPYYMRDDVHNNSTTTSSSSSSRKNHILGLHLMHLLVEHRLAEFHSVLEVISERDASTSPFLSFPIGLERQLMVGMYDEIFQTPIPHASYQFFVDHYLQQTVRDSIADGMEVAFQSLTLQDAAQMMKFDTIAELKEYIQEYRDDWIIESSSSDSNAMESDETQQKIMFSPVETTLTASDIAANDWIQQSLQYAMEMERIV
ncbi:hypothetical protein ACA910_005385 [Epithemia clementina (nom. ined.)]